MRSVVWSAGVVFVAATSAGAQETDLAATSGAQTADLGLVETLDAIRAALDDVEQLAARGDPDGASRRALRVYLDHYEGVEALYGAGGPRGARRLSELVTAAESDFHRLMRGGDAAELRSGALALRGRIDEIERLARAAGVPLGPADDVQPLPAGAVDVSPSAASTPEIRWILERLDRGREAYAAGHTSEALAHVEEAYLEGFELIEARLPTRTVRRIESLFHLRLRPQIARNVPPTSLEPVFATLDQELLVADTQLGGSTWFGVFNAFVIIVREGLEAVLLIGAMLAYLSASGADARHSRRVYVGAGLGVVASFATWFLARTLVPVSGASRELIEGITALVAVAVLLYVSHWLFQKTYIHDWKRYLREHVGRAVTTGSALAMAGLAFAAVYREGFETVLFYQALLFDAGAGAVLAGFVPGMLLIVVVGFAIVRLGLRLPLRTVFTVTNAILLYLAFVFLGKGLYNLQEAGLFSAAPVLWLPDSEALRQLMGVYPVAQTLLAQAALLLTLLATYAVYRRRLAVLVRSQ
jgi:FTR1 family protein